MFGIFGKPDLNKLHLNRDIPGLIKVINKSDPETKRKAAKIALALMSESGDSDVLSSLIKNYSNAELVDLWFDKWEAGVTTGKGKLAVIYRKIGAPIVDIFLLKLNDPKIQENSIEYGDLITLLGHMGDLRTLRPIFNISMRNKPLRGVCGYAIANLYAADKNGDINVFMPFYNECSEVEKGALEMSIWLVDKKFGQPHLEALKAAGVI